MSSQNVAELIKRNDHHHGLPEYTWNVDYVIVCTILISSSAWVSIVFEKSIDVADSRMKSSSK